MNGRTVRDVLADYLWEDWGHEAADKVGGAMVRDLGLDPDTPFDPKTQRCVVVDVCTTCEGKGQYGCDCDEGCCPFPCPDCEGRGWVIP